VRTLNAEPEEVIGWLVNGRIVIGLLAGLGVAQAWLRLRARG
jgi:hypothetical protein